VPIAGWQTEHTPSLDFEVQMCLVFASAVGHVLYCTCGMQQGSAAAAAATAAAESSSDDRGDELVPDLTAPLAVADREGTSNVPTNVSVCGAYPCSMWFT
jgi:hypothetical protein